ncbi:MAG: metal ABC transporter permease [Elusimicrobia bacterium]|nr:metal ABC transporter permease [Elusimicrobiota bacterium]
MPEIAEFLLWPALACLVITGMHAYLGLHVVERGVIFVDLALAQVAALGAIIAFLAGYGLHGGGAYAFSLAFTLIGAAIFAFTRTKKNHIPQEAIIGIVYAISSAAAILIMDRLPEGAEHIKHLLVGNLLAVRPHEVLKMAGLYAVIGFLHWLWRKPFLAISTDPGEAARLGYRVRLWDFLFYATFGFVVTLSVAIAGVLLAFSYLIVPSVAAMFFCDRVPARLAIGWSMGTIVSLVGMYASYRFDLPTGAAVICVFGAALCFMALFKRFVPVRGRRLSGE